MSIEEQIETGIAKAFKTVFDVELPLEKISLQSTRKDFEGAYTFVTFPYGKLTRKKPEETGQLLGEELVKSLDVVSDYNVVKGFLNLVIPNLVWVKTLMEISKVENFGFEVDNGHKVMVEYSSPNTNKPLHLGHLRNNFLGHSVAMIMEANGYNVLKTNLVNDRGIHICKSMLAYQKFGNGEEPGNDVKGDKLVGNYYVKFDQEYKKEVNLLFEKLKAVQPAGKDEELKKEAEQNAPLLVEAKEMLLKWENKDPEVTALWEKMNGWVYSGFDQTYKLMGVEFDKIYYESETYLLGKDIVNEGLEKNIFFKKEDASVWVDLSDDGLDEKLLLRGDGTSVYMTQDMGTADLKYKDFPMEKSVYVVGNEQDYHFKVLQLIMKKLGRSYADGIFHLSYGMVDLPSGKMKSREGTVVDADDLINDMIATAKERTEALGKIDEFSQEEAYALYHNLALGALKYYLLKVDPKKRMLFNPEESIDFQGDTGVYIQYNFAKMNSILRKAKTENLEFMGKDYSRITDLAESEQDIISLIYNFPNKIKEAADTFSPSVIANYSYDLARAYSRLWSEVPILAEQNEELKAFRVFLTSQLATVLKKSMALIGVQVPERM
ncbi:MAG: arginine--tRNA ligase [Flammeovirgaceae bacterium]|nr:arginine--tRNA ligase [Flammeovirgaceae bacterium]